MATTSPDLPAGSPQTTQGRFWGMLYFLYDPAEAAQYVRGKWFWVGPLVVFSAVTTTAGPNAALQVQALSQRVGQNLLTQPGQQSIEDIQADLATAQLTIKNAKTRQTQAQGMLQGIVDQAESVSRDQVASQLLAVQTSLQASYQTTAMLSQLTLTKYLPIA